MGAPKKLAHGTSGPGGAPLRELDRIVVGMELTLISIIQGVALYFLAEGTIGLVEGRRWELLPYPAAGLLLIFIVWSRAILHVLTIVRWPLELVHTFLYIAIALGQSLAFSSVDDPPRWFVLCTATAVVVWITYVFDLGIVDRGMSASGKSGRELHVAVRHDQVRNVRLVVPLLTALCAAAAIATQLWPDRLVAGGGHLVLVAVQIVALGLYLGATLRLARRLAQLVSASLDA